MTAGHAVVGENASGDSHAAVGAGGPVAPQAGAGAADGGSIAPHAGAGEVGDGGTIAPHIGAGAGGPGAAPHAGAGGAVRSGGAIGDLGSKMGSSAFNRGDSGVAGKALEGAGTRPRSEPFSRPLRT